MIWLLATNNKQLYPLPEKKFPLALREASCIEISEGIFPPSPRVTWRWLVSDSGLKISSHLIQAEITDNTGNYCCSVANLCSALCDLHGLQHTGIPCSSLSPRVCLNSCPLNWWYYPTISSSVTLFSWPPPFPASGSFPMSQLFASADQSIRTSAYFQWNIHSWFPLGLTGIISLQSRGLSRVFSSNTIQKHQFFGDWPS